MNHLQNYADDRLLGGCTYCNGAPEETRDHVPSRVFLDSPYPTNLPVVPACNNCNNGFARDEEYLACLIECAHAGSTDPDQLGRPSIGHILRRSPGLRSRIEAQKTTIDGQLAFVPENKRVCKVIEKLARGHAAFELSLLLKQEPTSLTCWPLATMTDEERESYDAAEVVEMLSEIGSRGMQRLCMVHLIKTSQAGHEVSMGLLFNNWVDVQEARYRYLAIDDGQCVKVKIVIREYLACEVVWLQ